MVTNSFFNQRWFLAIALFLGFGFMANAQCITPSRFRVDSANYDNGQVSLYLIWDSSNGSPTYTVSWADTSVSVTTPYVSLVNIEPQSTYNFELATSCSWGVALTNPTLQVNMIETVPWMEDFTGITGYTNNKKAPADWNLYNPPGVMDFPSINTASGVMVFTKVNWSVGDSASVFTPEIFGLDVGDKVLSFFASGTSNNNTDESDLILGFSNEGAAKSDIQIFDTIEDIPHGEFGFYSIPLDANTGINPGDLRVGFFIKGDGKSRVVALDDVRVTHKDDILPPAGLSGEALGTDSIQLTWDPRARAENYIIEYYNQGILVNNIWTSDTSLILSGLGANEDYFITIQSRDSNSVVSFKTKEIQVTTEALSGYCTPKATDIQMGIGFTNVTIGGLNNNTGYETNGYGNYDSLVAYVAAGDTAGITVTINNSWSDFAAVFVDWNRDTVFDMSELTLIGATNWGPEPFATSNTTLHTTIDVPATAFGNYIMRVGHSFDLMGGCSMYMDGFVEDYTLNVSGPSIAICDSVRVDMYDSYGDGWNGAEFKGIVGSVSTDISLGNGGFGSQKLGVANGDTMRFNWIDGGEYPEEIAFYFLNDVTGDTLFSADGVLSLPYGELFEIYCSTAPASGPTVNDAGCLECASLSVGDFFVHDGDSIEVVDRTRLLEIIADEGDLTKVCVSHVTDMKNLFASENWFNQDISSWDVSNVTTMRGMFKNADTFNQDISNWEVDSVKDMTEMFARNDAFNQSLNGWNVSSVEYFSRMFKKATSFNSALDQWRVYSASRMAGMFDSAVAFNQDLSGWCVSQFDYYNIPAAFGTNSAMTANQYPVWGSCFNSYDNVVSLATGVVLDSSGCLDCSALNVGDYFTWFGDTLLVVDRPMLDSLVDLRADLTKVCVSHITDMTDALRGETWFDQDISMWDVSNVTLMTNMFYKAFFFDQNIGNWDMSNVTNMSRMFQRAMSFDQDLSGWDVSNVTRMNGTFRSAVQFNQDLSSWDVSQVFTMEDMFRRATKFDQDLSGWCVPLIASRPSGFETNSMMAATDLPVWGSCPTGGSAFVAGQDMDGAGEASFENVNALGVELYPNPTNGVIELFPVLEGSFTMYNGQGQVLESGAIRGQYDLSGLPNGMYMLHVETARGSEFLRVVKH